MRRVSRFLRGLLVPLLLLAALVACQSSGGGGPPPTGVVLPTVAGAPGTSFSNPREAREAFTRFAGSLQATLEDAAWLRFEGNPETVAKEHRAYFDYGYTTFDVTLTHKERVRPTDECFVLEDNLGARLTGSPTCYEGADRLQDGLFLTTFYLSFQHMLTRDVKWIRLSWPAGDNCSSVEWSFVAEPPCPPPACAPPAPACPPPVRSR